MAIHKVNVTLEIEAQSKTTAKERATTYMEGLVGYVGYRGFTFNETVFTEQDLRRFITTLSDVRDEYYCSEQDLVGALLDRFKEYMHPPAPEEVAAVELLKSLGYKVEK